MAKVFRIHDGEEVKTGWFVSNPVTSDQLNDIITDGKNVATSIPSPFARIDLVKSAFKWVAGNKLEGNTAQHKLVSDALDIGQLFFLSNIYHNEIKIKEIDLNVILNHKENINHQALLSSLKVFWDQDGDIYNFDKEGKIYLIFYKNKLAGATSPATLFVSSPDSSASNLEMNITQGTDVLLDNVFMPLYKRDWSFIRYMFCIYKSKGFVQNLRANGKDEVHEYLTKTLQNLPPEKKDEINSLTSDSINEYQACIVSGAINHHCSILNIPLGLRPSELGRIKNESGFVVRSSFAKVFPLILPDQTFSQRWPYTSTDNLWDPGIMQNQVPVKNVNSDSPLPVSGDIYPWLTRDNFLTEKVIQLPYKIDQAKFNCVGGNEFLLPLTETFFEYFKPEEINSIVKLSKLAGGGLNVELDIPVRGGIVKFKKLYNVENIIKESIHLAILPFAKLTRQEHCDYTIGLITAPTTKASLTIFEEGKECRFNNTVTRIDDAKLALKSTIFKSKKLFDCLQIRIEDASGFIVPKFDSYIPSTRSIKFAIDFGTTNSYIEYAIDGNASLPLEFKRNTVIVSLIDKNPEIKQDPYEIELNSNFELQLIPYQIEGGSEASLPTRTALIHNNQIDFRNPIEVFAHTNNFLLYEKRFRKSQFHIKTDLKWSNYSDPRDKDLVKAYIKGMLSLTYLKTIELNIDFENLNIIWFYPVSMDEAELNILRTIWNESYQDVFKTSPIEKIKSIPESIPPYLHYKSTITGLSLAIDIGGGSSDLALFDEQDLTPQLISSFKFAGNAIYGDGYLLPDLKNDTERNGFVSSYQVEVKNLLNNHPKEAILNEILSQRKSSSDFSNFLFSLEKDQNLNFNYTKLLQTNDQLKICFLVFFGAIIYYSANLLKLTRNKIPKNILFSGTAAKALLILDTNQRHSNFNKLVSHIFTKVYDQKIEDLKIVLSDRPKEITSSGSLKANYAEETHHEKVKFWLGSGTSEENIYDKHFNLTTTPTYQSVLKNGGDGLVESINDYYKILDEFSEVHRLDSLFFINAESYKIFKEIRSENLSEFLIRGIRSYYKDNDQKVEETLFFYPLIGVLNNLAYELGKE